MKKLSIYSIFLISLLVHYGYTLKTPSAVEIENYYGDMMFLISKFMLRISTYLDLEKKLKLGIYLHSNVFTIYS